MAAVTGIVFAGCTKDNTLPDGGSLNMTVKASTSALTRVSYNGLQSSFTQGDTLSLYAWLGSADEVAQSLVVDGVVNTFNGEVWIPETQMLWKNVRDEHYFIGISPAKQVHSFTADEYILDPTDYAKSDLLLATELSGLKAASGSVDLAFSHALAKLNVNLKFRSQWAETPAVTSVAATAKRSYTVNYLTKAVTATGDEVQVALQALATAATGYALSFSGLQVPQDSVTQITAVIGGKEFVFNAAEPIVLESGKVTTLGLIVGREQLTLGSVTIDDWSEGTTYAEDGEALTDDTPVALDVTNPAEGQVIGSDGKNYAYASLPDGVTAIAIINYVSGENGLALALTDEGAMDWFAASSTCAAHTPAFSNGTWRLPGNTDWENMINGAGDYDALRTSFEGVGGTNLLQDTSYWSANQNSITHAYAYDFFYKMQSSNNSKYTSFNVRACLAF